MAGNRPAGAVPDAPTSLQSPDRTAGLDPTYALAEFTGWAIAALTCVTVALPYLLRRRARPAPTYLARLRPHYWIGFTLAGLSLLHAGLAMSSGPTPGGGDWAAGIWVATGALLLVLGQVSIGVGLRKARGAERRRRRRLHFLTMTLLVTAGLVHVVLNGPVARSLLAHARTF
jgi:hypothetical protein